MNLFWLDEVIAQQLKKILIVLFLNPNNESPRLKPILVYDPFKTLLQTVGPLRAVPFGPGA